jgi:hypothetical protein
MNPNEAYHNDTSRISKSGLDLIHQSPAHYYAKYLDPNRVLKEHSPDLLLGSLVHTAVLEPHMLIEEYAVAPNVDRRTKSGKDDWEAFLQFNSDKIVITQDQWDTAQRLRDAVYKHKTAREFLEMAGIVEEPLFWTAPVTIKTGEVVNVKCKAKPDKRLEHQRVIIDLKTTRNAKPNDFAKSAVNYRYDVQAAWYRSGFNSVFGQELDAFIFIAVEKEAPYGVSVLFAPDEVFRLGESKYEKDLLVYAECMHNNQWPCYSPFIDALTLPKWAFENI